MTPTLTPPDAIAEAAIGMTAATLEALRARSRARLTGPVPPGPDDLDVALLIDDRDALLGQLVEEAATVDVLVRWLRQSGAAPGLPCTGLPGDAAVSAHITAHPQVLETDEFIAMTYRDLHARRTYAPEQMSQVMHDRTALLEARGLLAAQLLGAQARAHTLAAWLARLLGPPQD